MQESLKIEVLQKIYEIYHKWSRKKDFACFRGCAQCCTRNVMVTSLEGRLVLAKIRKDYSAEWLTERLGQGESPACPLTMNEWAGLCMSENYQGDDQEPTYDACFLLAADNSCPIYEVRPFACRCFASVSPCHQEGAASQPGDLLAVNTAVLQIIEHLDQGGMYGSLGNILAVLSQKEKYNLKYLRRAKPLPAFISGPEDRSTVENFLQTLFQEKINGKYIQDILNNG